MTRQQAGVSAERIAKWLHLKMSAAQNLPYSDGDTCEECVEAVREELLPLLATAPPEQAALEQKGGATMTRPTCNRCGRPLIMIAPETYGDCDCDYHVPDAPPQPVSAGALSAREWLIEWNNKRMLHPSQDNCVESLANLLAAHDQKVRAEVCEQAAELIEEMSKRPGAFTWGDVKKAIRNLPAPAASKPEAAK